MRALHTVQSLIGSAFVRLGLCSIRSPVVVRRLADEDRCLTIVDAANLWLEDAANVIWGVLREDDTRPFGSAPKMAPPPPASVLGMAKGVAAMLLGMARARALSRHNKFICSNNLFAI